jgi:hypothetical protein
MFNLCYLCLFVQSCQTHTTNMAVFYKIQELHNLRKHLGSPSVFAGVHVCHLRSLLSYGALWFVIFALLCLSSSCVPCAHCFPCLWVVHSCIPLRRSQTFIYNGSIHIKKRMLLHNMFDSIWGRFLIFCENKIFHILPKQ